MTGFFARMAERAQGTEEPLRPRRPARFENPSSASGGLAVEEIEVDAAVPEPAPAPPRADVAPVVVRRETVVRTEDPALEPAPEAAPLASAPEPEPPAAPPVRADRRDEAETPPGPAPRPEAPETPRAEPAPGRRATEEPAPRPAPPAPRPPAPRRERRTRRPRAPAVELAVLLREHVVPALVQRGVVEPGERPVTAGPASATPRRDAAPEAGTVAVRATPPAPPVPTADREAGDAPAADPAVHVHIDRVVVTRAPAPPPPAPPAAPRPPRRTVDHAAYLARRQERP